MSIMQKNILVIFLLCFMPLKKIIGAELQIKTEIDTNEILIGDQVVLSYILSKPEEIEILMPKYGQMLTKGVEIIGQVQVDTSLKDDALILTQNLTLTSFDTGMFYIPPQAFVVKTPERIDSLFSKDTWLKVHGVAIDTTGTVRNIKAPMKAPVTFKEAWPYGAGALLLAILAYFVHYYYSRVSKGKPVFKPEKPKEPAHLVALRSLDKLRAQKLLDKGDVKEFHTQLSIIVRRYIEDRYKILALEQTTREILIDLFKQGSNIPYDKELLEELLSLADLVKYAKGEPSLEENEAKLNEAYNFVKSTKLESHVDGNAKKKEEG